MLGIAMAVSSVGALRVALRSNAWVVSAALCFSAACAADPGDPLKTVSDGSGLPVTENPDAGGGDIGDDAPFGDDSSASEMETGAVGGDDAGDMSSDADQGGGQPEAGPETGPGLDANSAPETSVGDGGCNLQSIPTSCPNCATQNQSDMPICKTYLMCFSTNGCDPHTACGSNDGTCGVNKLGGGEAPYTAAVATYDCACP
jgi:hypothetical protein